MAAHDRLTHRTLPPFPTDDVSLHMLERAVNTCVDVRPDGEFTLPQLLDFMSNYDPTEAIDTGDLVGGTPVVEYPHPIYSEADVIRALIVEIRSLRAGGDTA